MAKKPRPTPQPKKEVVSSKKEQTTKGHAKFQEALSTKFTSTKKAVEAVLGKCTVPRVDIILKTSVVCEKNGRFLLPDDVDEASKEEVEFRFSVIPTPESNSND